MIDAQELLTLLNGEFSSLSIGFNEDHACNYAKAADWDFYAPESEDSRIEWASEVEREKAIRTNSVWTIQWYPDTPVGFCCVGASTFDAAARYALDLERI